MNTIHCHAMTLIIISSRIQEDEFLDEMTDIERLEWSMLTIMVLKSISVRIHQLVCRSLRIFNLTKEENREIIGLMSLLVSNADEKGLVISKIHQMILILPVKVIKKSLSYIGISYNHSCICCIKNDYCINYLICIFRYYK